MTKLLPVLFLLPVLALCAGWKSNEPVASPESSALLSKIAGEIVYTDSGTILSVKRLGVR